MRLCAVNVASVYDICYRSSSSEEGIFNTEQQSTRNDETLCLKDSRSQSK